MGEEMITKFQGAAIVEQGVKFAVVIVQPHILTTSDKTEANRLIAVFQVKIFGVPVALMAPDPLTHAPRYYGRDDIVKFLASVPVDTIPWQEFTLTE
jgi:hypothetical protein